MLVNVSIQLSSYHISTTSCISVVKGSKKSTFEAFIRLCPQIDRVNIREVADSGISRLGHSMLNKPNFVTVRSRYYVKKAFDSTGSFKTFAKMRIWAEYHDSNAILISAITCSWKLTLSASTRKHFGIEQWKRLQRCGYRWNVQTWAESASRLKLERQKLEIRHFKLLCQCASESTKTWRDRFRRLRFVCIWYQSNKWNGNQYFQRVCLSIDEFQENPHEGTESDRIQRYGKDLHQRNELQP